MAEESKKGEQTPMLQMTLEEAQRLVNLANEMPTKFGLSILQVLQGIQQRAQALPTVEHPPAPPAPAKAANGAKRVQA